VSSIFSALPTSESDPLRRVAAVHEAMSVAKGQFDLIPADTLVALSDLAPPALAVRAARVAARARLADRTNPPANLVISNVPGPRDPLYMYGGAKLKRYYPVSMVVDGQGLNITVQSYVDGLDFGLVSCRELVPDLWKVMDYLFEEIDILAEAAGVGTTATKADDKKAGHKK
jgi:diacylglycerol O-acyltransferase